MKFVILTTLVLMSLRISTVTALVAESIGKSYWAWFALGVFLPLVAIGIVLCLPRPSRKKAAEPRPVENHEIFDHLFITKHPKRRS